MSDVVHDGSTNGTLLHEEDSATFADFIARERSRLDGERRALTESIEMHVSKLRTRLESVNAEIRAINAYEAAKVGKPARATVNGNSNRVRRPRDGSRKQAIVAAVSEVSEGLARGELIERLGLKGDKSGEMSVSNALTGLTKAGTLIRENGKYRRTLQPGDAVYIDPVLQAAAE